MTNGNSKAFKLAETTVGVAYDTDIDHALETIKSVCDSLALENNRPPQIGIDNFGDSGIDIGIRYWLPTNSYHEQRFDFNQRVFAALKSAGITIPFPQREVRVLNQKGQEPT